MTHFDVYGQMATENIKDACQNGRYSIQSEAQNLIPQDVITKLRPCNTDDFLDIGCGTGLNLLPIAQMVKTATGCDHPNVVKKIQHAQTNLTLIGDDFLKTNFDRKFEKILSYSVLPALPNIDVLMAFTEKALSLLTADGRMLLGDMANQDKKQRFVSSARGQQFIDDWNEQMSTQSCDDNLSAFSDHPAAVTITDAVIIDIMRMVRGKGFHAYVVDQPQNLPFGNSREDILIIGPEHQER